MFQNKTAIVTGASSGIGYETALLLAKKGAHVIAVARREDRLRDLASQEKNITPVVLDVTDDLSALDVFLQNKKIDILVNNAGLAWGKEPIMEAPRQKWETMIDTNIKALIAMTQKILPFFLKNGGGDIVNIGSIAAYEYYGGGAQYAATKAAVRALTESWRHDLIGKNIRVMGIHPGMVDTEFSLVRFDGDKAKADQVYSGMTPLTGKDIAEAIVWSLSCPRHVNIQSMVIMPTEQANVWNVHRNR